MNTYQLICSFCVALVCLACTPRLYVNNTPSTPWPSYKDQMPTTETFKFSTWTTMTTTLADGSYRLRHFYPEKKQCTHLVTATDKSLNIKEGEYKEWWDDGFKKTEGQYKNNERIGLWKNYGFNTGKLQSESEYVNDEKNGVQKNYGKHGLISTYTFVNDLKEGPFTVYDSTGIVVNDGMYKADTLYQQSIMPEKSKQLLTVVEIMPKFPGCPPSGDESKDKACGQKKMLEHIYGNIKYPADARENGLEGTCIIMFVIDKDGEILNPVAIRGLCRSIENECLRLVNSMPKWNPGMQNNKPVKVQFNLPIKFKLQ